MRKPLILFLCILLLCILPFSVYAHPGRTNSDGGHWDYESGNYHYHHGYPAHDHTDLDSDGYADCPYVFDDNTRHSSGNDSIPDSHTNNRVQSELPNGNPDRGKPSLWDIISVIFTYLPGAIALWLFSSYLLFFIFSFFFGEDQGCSAAMIAGAVIALVMYIWSIIAKFS